MVQPELNQCRVIVLQKVGTIDAISVFILQVMAQQLHKVSQIIPSKHNLLIAVVVLSGRPEGWLGRQYLCVRLVQLSNQIRHFLSLWCHEFYQLFRRKSEHNCGQITAWGVIRVLAAARAVLGYRFEIE
jgi:hypothetical protein